NFEHVRIVPSAGSGEISGLAVGIYSADHAREGVVDIASRAPGVAFVWGPIFVVSGVGAKAVDNGATRFHQAIGHSEIIFLRNIADGEFATVVLEVIDAPGGVGEGIDIFITIAAWRVGTGAGVGTVISVNAELEAFGMDIIGEGFHAAGKFGRVDDNDAVGI